MAIQIASLFASIGAESKGLEKGLSDAESKIKTTAKNVRSIGEDSDTGLGANWLNTAKTIAATAAPLAAALGTVKKVLDFSHEGAQLQRLEDTSFSLARSMGMDMGHIMDSVRTASLGMVSDADIMQASSRALMLGVGDSAAQMGQLMEVAAMRGRAMGISTTQAFNDIVTGIGRMSPLILDNLGIVTGGQKTFDDYAASIGKVAEALTDAEKKQALINKAIEGTAPLLEAEGGLARDVAGNWEYATAQIKTYIENKKKAIALERGGDKGFDYADGMPVGKTGGLGYIEGIGLAFERANIDSHNKELLHLAASIGLVSEADAKWIDMPIISTKESRAEWVQQLSPALKEYSRLVNETGMSSTKAAEQVRYLYDTYGSAAFIDKTDEWVAANDRVWGSLDNSAASANRMSDAALANQQRLSAWRAELYETARALRDDLTVAYENVAVAEQGWRGSVAGDLAGRLAEDYKNNKISLDQYRASLGLVDKSYGTATLAALDFSLGLDELYKTLKEDPEGFAEAASAFEAMFMPLDAAVQASMGLVGNLQAQLSALEKTYTAKVNIVIATYGSTGNLPTGGDEGGGGGKLPQFGHAMGGYELAGQPYIVGEAGPELFIPDTNGRVYSNASSGAMMGGGNGDLLAALGRLPTASDIAMAVRDALLMVGA
jgi:hypothetical protein